MGGRRSRSLAQWMGCAQPEELNRDRGRGLARGRKWARRDWAELGRLQGCKAARLQAASTVRGRRCRTPSQCQRGISSRREKGGGGEEEMATAGERPGMERLWLGETGLDWTGLGWTGLAAGGRDLDRLLQERTKCVIHSLPGTAASTSPASSTHGDFT